MRTLPATGILALLAMTAGAGDRPAGLIHETWETVLLDGARIGSLHTSFREIGENGRFRSDTELDLSFRCHGTPVQMRREFATEETSDGRISAVSMKQLQDRGRQLTLAGTVEDGRLHVIVDGGRIERRIPWGDDVLGLAAQERLLVERRPKTGERFSFRRYEPTFNTVVTVRVTVKEPEAVGEKGTKLLRVELQPDRIEAAGTSVQPSGSVVWLDKGFLPVRREIELDGIGKVLLLRTTKETATGRLEKPTDLVLRNQVPLDRRISNPHATRAAVYRITLNGEPASAFARDGHQDVRNIRGDTFDLYVHPARPLPGANAGPAADEFLSRNYFIDSDDARIRELARRATGAETDAWSKAVRIERWVFESMHTVSGAPFVPASQIARELSGDCRACSILTAALCRAAGIPSRTAIGLIYTDNGTSGPKLGFHMWTEVNVGGHWFGLDGTLGQGGIGACHLKISDHSWSDTRSLTPLLPANRVLGKIAVEVASVDPGK
jgi:transglutaminase-like putative cysteine protease